jgi:hypothetical protein
MLRKRNRNPLTMTAHEARYATPSLKANMYLEGSLARPLRSPEDLEAQAQTNSHNITSTWGFQSPAAQEIKRLRVSSEATTTPRYYFLRRLSINYLFVTFGSPAEEDWKETGVIEEIMRRLEIDDIDDHSGHRRLGVCSRQDHCGSRLRSSWPCSSPWASRAGHSPFGW